MATSDDGTKGPTAQSHRSETSVSGPKTEPKPAPGARQPRVSDQQIVAVLENTVLPGWVEKVKVKLSAWRAVHEDLRDSRERERALTAERDEAMRVLEPQTQGAIAARKRASDAEAEVTTLRAACETAREHVKELREAWERGAISEHDSLERASEASAQHLATIARLRDALHHAVYRNHGESGGCDGCHLVSAALAATDGADAEKWLAEQKQAAVESAMHRLATDAIDLFLEYRDQHGHDEKLARACALNEFSDAASARGNQEFQAEAQGDA